MSLLDTKVSLSIGIKLKEMTIDELRVLNGTSQDTFPLLAGNETKSVIGYGVFHLTILLFFLKNLTS